MDMGMRISLQYQAFNSLGYIPQSRIAGLYGNFIFQFFWGLNILFSMAAVPFYRPTNSARWFIYLHLCEHLLFPVFVSACLVGFDRHLEVGDRWAPGWKFTISLPPLYTMDYIFLCPPSFCTPNLVVTPGILDFLFTLPPGQIRLW